MKKIIYICLLVLGISLIFSCTEDSLEDGATGTITGKVVLDGSLLPVANARISTNPSTTTVFTDSLGKFILNQIEEGDYSVQAKKDSLVAGFQGASVLAGRTVNVIFELKGKSSLYEPPTAPVLVSPEDQATGVQSSAEFVWEPSKSKNKSDVTYSLKIINPSTNQVLQINDIADTTYTAQGLEFSQSYVWQVGAADELTEPVYSDSRSFKTVDYPAARILFTRIINGNSVIFSLDDDDNEFQLTSSSKNSFRPRRNNQVNKIAFLRTVNSQTQLFTMNLDGSNSSQVTTEIPVRATNPETVDFSWANNGNKLVYPSFHKLYKVNATGGGTAMIYETTDNSFISNAEVSDDDSKIALITNDSQGYNAKIELISMDGSYLQNIVEGFPGALGGIDFSATGNRLLYTRDVSGFEDPNYRQLNNRMFIYDFSDDTSTDVSQEKIDGTNDLDPRFSPNEAKLIFTNTSNDGVSQKNVFTSSSSNNTTSRMSIIENASMPDWY